MTDDRRPQTANRGKLLLLALLFFAPVIAAYLFYLGPESWRPSATTENGELISPAVPLPELAWQFVGEDQPRRQLAELWTLLHVLPDDCGVDCQERLWQTRQLRTSLHRHRDRVRRVALVSSSGLAQRVAQEFQAEHPRLGFASLVLEDRRRLDAILQAQRWPQPVFLIDPLGNWLMVYPDDVPLKGMYRDIKKLLKLSQIG